MALNVSPSARVKIFQALHACRDLSHPHTFLAFSWAGLTSGLVLLLSSVLFPWNLGFPSHPLLPLDLRYPPILSGGPAPGDGDSCFLWILSLGDQGVPFGFSAPYTSGAES